LKIIAALSHLGDARCLKTRLNHHRDEGRYVAESSDFRVRRGFVEKPRGRSELVLKINLWGPPIGRNNRERIFDLMRR